MRNSDDDADGEQRYKQTTAPVMRFVLRFRQRFDLNPCYPGGGDLMQQFSVSSTVTVSRHRDVLSADSTYSTARAKSGPSGIFQHWSFVHVSLARHHRGLWGISPVLVTIQVAAWGAPA